MVPELEVVFSSYVQSARHKLQEAAKPSMIRAKVEDLERTSQFQRLLAGMAAIGS